MKSTSLFVILAATACFSLACTQTSNIPSNAVPPVTTQTTASPVKSESPVPGLPTAMPADSQYTSLSEKDCKETDPGQGDDGIIYKGECPGVAGYKIINLSTDHTQGLVITDSAGKEHKLDLRGPLGTVADLFLGDKIEWRMSGKGADAKPTALIVQVNVQKEPGNSDKQDSNLAVIKVGRDAICVTDYVTPGEKDQNVKARQLADTAGSRPCLKSKME